MVSYDLSRVFGLLPSLLQALPTTLWIMFVTALIGFLARWSVGLGSDCRGTVFCWPG